MTTLSVRVAGRTGSEIQPSGATTAQAQAKVSGLTSQGQGVSDAIRKIGATEDHF